jgi:hypothetical protein
MNKIIEKIFHGKDNAVNGLIALAIIASIALGCNCNKSLDLNNSSSSSNSSSDNPFDNSSTSDSGLPGEELTKALVNETTADFAYSISEGDFTKMYDKASTDFKSTYTKDQLQSSFKDFIDKKRQVLPILSKATSSEPEFTSPPSLRSEQGLEILVVNGKYSTRPMPVTFNYEYVKRNGSWKLLVLKIFIR